MKTKKLHFKATTDIEEAYKDSDYIIGATPTNYNPEINYFDTSSVDNVVEGDLVSNKSAVIVIKPTVPIGYTQSKRN